MEQYFQLQYLKEMLGIAIVAGLIIVGVGYYLVSSIKEWIRERF